MKPEPNIFTISLKCYQVALAVWGGRVPVRIRVGRPFYILGLLSARSDGQPRKLEVVSSNLTSQTNFASLVKWYNSRLITGHRRIVTCRRHQNLQPCISEIGHLVGIWSIVPIYGTTGGVFDPPASNVLFHFG